MLGSGSFTQNVTLPAGTYNVSFGWEGNSNAGGVTVSLGGHLLFTGAPTVTQSFIPTATNYVTLPAGTYALTFAKTDAAIIFIDDIQINNDPGTFYWQAASGDFNNAVNWGRDRPPGPSDTAVIASGTFSPSTQMTAGTVNVTDPYTVPTGTDLGLNITGNWNFTSAVTLSAGNQVTVSGGGTAGIPQLSLVGTGTGISVSGNAAVTVTSIANPTDLTTISSASSAALSLPALTDLSSVTSITVSGSLSTLTFPSVTNYTQPGIQAFETPAVVWTAKSGGTLNFSSLASITGNVDVNGGLYNSTTLNIVGTSGGTVNLFALTTMNVPTGTYTSGYTGSGASLEFTATSSGVINAPLLSSFSDHSTPPQSILNANSLGILKLPKLTAISGVSLNLNDLSHPEQFTSITGTAAITLNSGSVGMSVTDLTGVNAITSTGAGTVLSFPHVSSYAQPGRHAFEQPPVQWTAKYGALLDFPALTSITGIANPQEGL